MKRLLIANRGEIARRVIRTAHAMGIDTVAVYSDADRDALHVREATTAFALGGLSSADSYLRVDRLLLAAQATGADAVHPGYGFLSENADFAQAVADAGLVWVGPPAAAIRALGSKSAAKALAHAQGVPCLPGYSGAEQDDAVFVAEAERIGFPLMVKAVAGGGGRGMRLVQSVEQLLPALHSARSEALASFGNGDLLIERALLRPRHVEVQIFADAHGHCIHLGERDCSVQRRHQKIIEEAPSPAVSPVLRAELGRCAVALAQAAGYVGAGTVEFLLDDPRAEPIPVRAELVEALGQSRDERSNLPSSAGLRQAQPERMGVDRGSVGASERSAGPPQASSAPVGGSEPHAVGSVGASERSAGPPQASSAPVGGSEPHAVESVGASFFLMEMNTRLQVEHPVTEMLTGLDLVEWQIRIARGEALPLTQDQVQLNGHAIEVRLCAEDVNHTPHTGRVLHFQPPDHQAPGLRFDHALETGTTVTPHYDAMLGKLIAHAPSREQAVDRLAHALDATQVLGLPTNRAFLAACLRHPVFRAGEARIFFLAEQGDALRAGLANAAAPSQPAALLALLAVQHAQAPAAATLALPFARPLRMALDGQVLDALVQELGGGQLRVLRGDSPHAATVQRDASGEMAVTLDGVRWSARAVQVGAQRWHVQLQGGDANGATDLWVDDLSHQPARRAGAGQAAAGLRAPFNGKLVAVHAREGDAVQRGAPLLVIESMKLEHTLSAPRDATVASIDVAVGQQVAPGQLLLSFAP
ncbi:MAG: biotin carboxylase N-terminal domain-containing protein [Hydrogenophaga sp.]|nr:biotin carboxylase N-terminal domain-containing protein [Hydrogenophaga sp.]